MIPKVLLVDDEEAVLLAYKRDLRKHFDVRTALGGRQALDILNRNGPFAVVISDLRMPGMNGIQFLEEAKERYSDTVRVMLTGQADLPAAMKAINEGNIFRFHTKPCFLEDLVNTIKAGIEQYQRQIALASENRRLALDLEASRRDAMTDSLTGIANRLRFSIRLEEAFAQANRTRKLVAVLLLDLDHFKEVNDTFGHPTGDLLLKAVSQRLTACVRETDTVARLGGDEFAIVATNLEIPSGAGRLASKVIKALAKPYSLDTIHVRSRASIGISIAYPTRRSDPAPILAEADKALYQAKNDGHGVFRYFDAEMNVCARSVRSMEAELSRALRAEELFLLFQPRLSIDRRFLTGAEVLFQWDHPIRGILGPDEVVPLAEAAGLLTELRKWELRGACKQIVAWLNDGVPPVPLTVRFSVAEFHRADIVAMVAGAMEEATVPQNLLELEIGESALTSREKNAKRLVQQLRDAGILISVGDFGVVHGSLTSLARVPVGKIIIERHFTKDVLKNPSHAAIAKSIVDVARNLDLTVCAKGVESGAEFSFLRTLGCHEVQGGYFSEPLTGDKFASWYRRSGLRAPVAGDVCVG